jgi:hypothetical protein
METSLIEKTADFGPAQGTLRERGDVWPASIKVVAGNMESVP